MDPILSAQHISKTYQMGEVKVPALADVTLDLYPGEFIVMLGHSGSGKSTLLNILGALDSPTQGELIFKGKNLTRLSESERTEFRRQSVGFVFQMYNLIPRLTAEENITLVTDISQSRMNAEAALDLVGLKSRKNHFPGQLSGGEQQRVAIARAVAKKPEILLCDEPTGALDLATGVLVLEAIAQVNRSLGTTTVVITHNVSIAAMANRVVRLADGKIESIIVNEKQISAQELSW